jgi:hypothetical protein
MAGPVSVPSAAPAAPQAGRWVHACIPGMYAWAVTVASSAFGRGSPWIAGLAGAMALVALVAGVPAGARWGARGRDASLWTFVLTCAVTWSLAPPSLSSHQFDWVRGAAGVLGWALFGLAWAAPPLSPVDATTTVRLEPGMAGRRPLPGGDALYLAFGAGAAGAMQLVGWGSGPPERALLVRFATLAAGIAVLGGIAEVAAVRFDTRRPRNSRIGVRRLLVWGTVLALLVFAGLLTR